MKKSLLLASVACLFAVNTQAADLKPYVSAKAKFVGMRAEVEQTSPIHTNVKLNDNVFGYGLAAGAGIKMEEGILRLELEYTSNDDAEKTIAGGKVKFESYAVFGNAYFDFNTNSDFRPYVGIGLGASKVKFGNKSETKPACNYNVGINYLLNDNVALDLGYRFTSYADFEEKKHVGVFYQKVEYKAHANELMLGVRFSF